MRAALFRRHGGPEVMEVGELPSPRRALARCRCASRRRRSTTSTCGCGEGCPRCTSASAVPGGDVCGVVAALGAGRRARRRRGRSRRASTPGCPAGAARPASTGATTSARDYRLIGEQTWGGQAEYVVDAGGRTGARAARARAPRRRGAGLDADRLHDRVADAGRSGADPAGRDGAGGGRGLGRGRGGHPDREALRGAGHRHGLDRRRSWPRPGRWARTRPIDHGSSDIVAEVKRLTGRRGADIVVEHVGAATFAKSIVACARAAAS